MPQTWLLSDAQRMPLTHGWADAIDGYLLNRRAAGHSDSSLYAYRQRLQHLAARVEVGPWLLTRTQLVGYAGRQEWEQETRRGRYATFSGFWAWGLREQLTDHNPTLVLDRIDPTEPAPNPVPDAVYIAALARADEDEQLWIDLAAEHGLRRGEVAVIHADDLIPTLVGHDIRVHGKGRKTRYVPLTPAMEYALLDRRDAGAGYLFPGADNGHVSARWLGRRVARLLGGEWTMHKLRHRAAGRFWEISGHDALAVMKLMGWASQAMVEVYVKLPHERLVAIVHGSSKAGVSRLAA